MTVSGTTGSVITAVILLKDAHVQRSSTVTWPASSTVGNTPRLRHGCGAVLSVFNPQALAKKFDPATDYANRQVPAIETGDYPEPVVDHAAERAEARAAAVKSADGADHPLTAGRYPGARHGLP